MGKFADDCLKEHNEKRGKHGVSKLKLSDKLCKHAQKWAEHLIKKGSLEHSECMLNGERLGENVASKWSSGAVAEYTGKEVTEQWYSEIKDYDFSSANPNMNAGHFSQVVWKDSRELGVGIAAKDGKCIVVANYSPAGNFIGRYKDNVLPPTLKGKVKGLFKGKKSGTDSSSSSSDDDEPSSSRRKAPPTRTMPASTGGSYTRKVTVTRTIRKPDGTVETVTEERIEEGKPEDDKFSQLKIADNNNEERGYKASPSSSSKVKSQSTSEFHDDALKAHNKYRSKHGASSLKLSKDLCKTAQSWAEHLAKISALQHSNAKQDGEPLGENIASKWGSNGADYNGADVTEQWYSEESAYDYTGRSNAGNAGHFSQVVWKGSKELGIGKAKDGKGRVYVVANYKPAGNFIGRFAENVSRPK